MNKMDKTKTNSSEAAKKDKMRNNRRCIIYGCNSSSLKDKDLKFFRFPSPDSSDYQIWLSACKDSYNQIRVLKKPLICSLHFVPEDIGGRRLSPNAFPQLRLTASQEYIDFPERDKKMKFLNEVMEEWVVRNRPHCDIYGKLLIEKAREASDLLDIPNYIPDKSWLKNFNEQIAAPDSKLFRVLDTCGTSLHMLDVIRDLTHLKQNRQDRRKDSFAENSIEISDDDDYDDGDFSDSYADLSSKLEVSVTVDEDRDFYEPQTKMPKLQSILLNLDDEDDEDGDDDNDDNTGAQENQKQKKKKPIGTYKDALKYMKPLESFALQNADFRAISLLTQLEAIFKQQQ